ncbi:MAG: hypothetical protein WBP42_09625 [Candidatus Zixiibacteriota bacterium]
MLNKIKFAGGLAVAVTIFAVMIGISLKQRSQVDAVDHRDNSSDVQSITETLATAPQEASEFGPDTNPIPEIMPAIERNERRALQSGATTSQEDLVLLDSLDFDDVRDVEIDYDRTLLATAGGVLEFFYDDSSFAIYSYPQNLLNYDCYAVLSVDDNILVGTSSGLYQIDLLGVVQPIVAEITDTVTTLENVEGCIYVGTRNQGLFQIEGNIVTQLLPNKHIIAVSDDEFALWCATVEDGLLYRDDAGWHERRLLNDQTALDTVTALQSAFGKLWVGTPNGLFIYNGDNWQRIDTTEYLFDESVTSLAAGKSFMYIGTAREGVFAYYNGWLSPLDWSDNLPITSLDIYDGKYLVGLNKGGAFLNTRKGVLDILPLVRQSQGILSNL